MAHEGNSGFTDRERAAFKPPACPDCGSRMTVTWMDDTRASDSQQMWAYALECEACLPCKLCGAPVTLATVEARPKYGETSRTTTVRRCSDGCEMHNKRHYGHAV